MNINEFKRIITRDELTMALNKDQLTVKKDQKPQNDGLKREPGFGWILDFNNDGLVSVSEMDEADQILQNEPKLLPIFDNSDKLKQEL